jgi:hypothetical protein
MIDKRTLRFVRITPLLAKCGYCNTEFSGNEGDIRQQFESHKCERRDFARDTPTVMREEAEDK